MSFQLYRAHPASEVYITGTFDGWKKTEKLDRVGDHFEKRVELSDASRKIYYKVRGHISALSCLFPGLVLFKLLSQQTDIPSARLLDKYVGSALLCCTGVEGSSLHEKARPTNRVQTALSCLNSLYHGQQDRCASHLCVRGHVLEGHLWTRMAGKLLR